MRRAATALLIASLAGILVLPSALAQTADTSRETIIVNGRRVPNTPNAIAHEVIRAFAAPSVLVGQIPRWHAAICPRTDGLSSRKLNDYVTARIRQVAAEAGAPLKDFPCRPNIQVFFTGEPQAALDAFHKRDVRMLGYHGATRVSHPIQAWYQTGTTDINGKTILDQDVMGTIEFTNGGGFVVDSRGRLVEQGMAVTNGIPEAAIEGWKGRPEVTSDFISVLIIADTGATGSRKLGAVADYIALLALARTEAFETCEIVPSVVNAMAPNCDEKLKTDALSLSDIGLLRGLYKMDPGASLTIEQDDIAGEMVKALQAGK
jgi:hypothetical protein